jgi:hypothetical protein
MTFERHGASPPNPTLNKNWDTAINSAVDLALCPSRHRASSHRLPHDDRKPQEPCRQPKCNDYNRQPYCPMSHGSERGRQSD